MTNSFKEWLLYEADGNMLGGAEKLVDRFKAGYKRGEQFNADKEKHNDAVAADQSKQDSVNLRSDIEVFIDTLFKEFPHGGVGGPEELMGKYESYASALEAFKIFKGYSEQVAKLRAAMNTSLVSQKKLTKEQITEINKQANKIAQGGQLPKQLIDFTRKESDFFTRLFKLSKDDFGLDERNFSSLLSSKMRSTDGGRINDAALALNMLFIYIETEFKSYYKYLATVGTKRKEN